MKQLIIIICFFLFSALNAQQINYEMQMSEDEIINSISSFYYKSIADYTISNSAYLRYSSEDFADHNYLSRYGRNRFYIERSWKNFSLGSFLYLAYYPQGNTSSYLSGIASVHHLNSSIGSGFNAKYFTESWYINVGTKYLTNQFEKLENESTNLIDANAFGNIEISSQGRFINPYLKSELFSDLNDSDIFNYQKIGFGLKNFSKISYAHFLKISTEIGYSHLYENIPYYGELKARFTTKLNRDWYLVNRINAELYLDEDFSDFYKGKNFTEHIIQYNFGYNQNNKNFIKSGIQIDLEGNSDIVLSGKFFLRYFDLLLRFQHIISDVSNRETEVLGQLEIPFGRNISFVLADEYESSFEENRFIIAMKLRR